MAKTLAELLANVKRPGAGVPPITEPVVPVRKKNIPTKRIEPEEIIRKPEELSTFTKIGSAAISPLVSLFTKKEGDRTVLKEVPKPLQSAAEYGLEAGKTVLEEGAKAKTAAKQTYYGTEKGRAVALNNLYQAVTGVLSAPLSPAVKSGLEKSGYAEELAFALTKAGKETAKKTGLDESKLSEEDLMNIGASELDAALAGATLGLAKFVTTPLFKGAISGMKSKGSAILKTATKAVTAPIRKKNIPTRAVKLKPVEDRVITPAEPVKAVETPKKMSIAELRAKSRPTEIVPGSTLPEDIPKAPPKPGPVEVPKEAPKVQEPPKKISIREELERVSQEYGKGEKAKVSISDESPKPIVQPSKKISIRDILSKEKEKSGAKPEEPSVKAEEPVKQKKQPSSERAKSVSLMEILTGKKQPEGPITGPNMDRVNSFTEMARQNKDFEASKRAELESTAKKNAEATERIRKELDSKKKTSAARKEELEARKKASIERGKGYKSRKAEVDILDEATKPFADNAALLVKIEQHPDLTPKQKRQLSSQVVKSESVLEKTGAKRAKEATKVVKDIRETEKGTRADDVYEAESAFKELGIERTESKAKPEPKTKPEPTPTKVVQRPVTPEELMVQGKADSGKTVTSDPKLNKGKDGDITPPFAPADNPVSGTTQRILDRETVQDAKFVREDWQSPWINRLISLDQFLNGIRMVVGNTTISFGNYVKSLKNLAKQVSNDIVRSFDIVVKNSDGTESSVKFADYVSNAMKGLKAPKDIGDDAFVGAKTPEGIEIGTDNAKIVRQTFEDIDSMDYRETFSFLNNKELNALAKYNYLWKINKERPDIISKYIPKELVKFFEALDANKTSLYEKAGQDLSGRGLVKYLYDYYERYVMLPDSYKRFAELGKGSKEFSVVLGDGTIRTFDSLLDMITYVKNAERLGYSKGMNISAETMSSLNKAKASGVADLYRVHSDVVQMLDYLREHGNLIRNDEIVKSFLQLNKSGDARVKDYVKNMFSSKFFRNPVEQSLGIKLGEGKKDVLGAKLPGPTEIVQKVGNIGTVGAMAFNLATLGLSTVSSVSKAALLNLGRVFTNVTKEANALLREHGFIQTYEGVGFRGAIGEKNIATFSGTPVENLAKAQVAVGAMKKLLTSKGKTITNDADAITKAFDKAISDGTVPKEEYLKWRDDVMEDINVIGSVTGNDRTNVRLLDNLSFSNLKTWSTGQVASTLRNTTKLFSSLLKRDFPAMKGPAKRLAVQVGGFYAMKYAVEQYYKANREEGQTDEVIDKLSSYVAGRAYGDPIAGIKNFLSGYLSNIAAMPIEVVIDAMNAVRLVATEGDKKLATKVGVNELLNDILSKTALGREIDKGTQVATGKSLRKIISERAGVFSREGTTKKVQATGFKTESRSEALAQILGINEDSAVQDFLYSALNKAEMRQSGMSPAEVAVASYANDIWKGLKRDVTGAVGMVKNFGEYNDELMLANYASQAVKASKGNETLGEYLSRVGIPESFRRDIATTRDANIRSMASSNNLMERAIGEHFFKHGIRGTTFSERLNDLLEKNPQAYNNFITGIARTSKYLAEEGKTEPNKNVEEEIKSFFAKSSTATDAAIAQATGKDPLSTSMTQIMQNALFEFSKDITKEGGLDEAKRKLKEVENFYKIVMDNSSYTKGLLNAAAIKSMELRKGIEEMDNAGYEDFGKDFPLLKEVITKGLELRGEFIPKPGSEGEPSKEDEFAVSKPSAPTVEESGKGTFVESNLSETGTLPQKEKQLKLSDIIRRTKEAPRPLFSKLEKPRGLTLSEILRSRK